MARAAAPMSIFFQTSAPHLVQVHPYYRTPPLDPDCGTLAPRFGSCAGRKGMVVWRSLPTTLQSRLTRSPLRL